MLIHLYEVDLEKSELPVTKLVSVKMQRDVLRHCMHSLIHPSTHTPFPTHTPAVFPAGGPVPMSVCSTPLSIGDPHMKLQCSP